MGKGNGNRSDPARIFHFRAERLSFPNLSRTSNLLRMTVDTMPTKSLQVIQVHLLLHSSSPMRYLALPS